MSQLKNPSSLASTLTGAVFLMATSAIGPGFITQTTVFTDRLRTSFGFIILCSIVIDVVVQMNVWRVISVSGMRTQDLANRTVQGSGYVLTFLVVLGGLAFNIGNVAGCGLGLQAMADVDVATGSILSMTIALVIFLNREVGNALDLFAKLLGLVMIALTAYIVFSSNPPLRETVHHSFFPETIDTTAIIILVGGTVGGYISFSGVHRLLDAGISGVAHSQTVSRSAVRAILVASLMRILLFLAALGVVSAGASLDPDNPAASVFGAAAGSFGYRIFGVVLWAAAITSVVGCAYTSVSFLKTLHPLLEAGHQWVTVAFIIISGMIFLIVGRPVTVLVIVGALNAFVLPLAMLIILVASRKRALMDSYRHPLWLQIAGWIVAAVLLIMGVKTAVIDMAGLWSGTR
ncbi:MAG TPA: NRAMP family divalent metal transporter [Chryseosolibacter sp.]|nr:NRAMP family divalent metal transporter [Chryseosolibacter sp.]